MPNNYIKFQVKSSGQWLNILNGGSTNGTEACQGEQPLPTNDNFIWEIINSAVSGWVLIQVKSSGQYLNIKNGGTGNGDPACQAPLANPNAAPDNFLWRVLQAPNNPGWSLIQVKSTNQYLNILNGGNVNGTVACQGTTPTSTNFLWMQSPAKIPKNVTVTMNILDCASIYSLQDGTRLSDAQANPCLSLEDDNRGGKENPNQSSFETILNPGSEVKWQPNIVGNSNNGFSIAINQIIYETGSERNVLGPVTAIGNSGKVKADVLWTATPPNGLDNESYTISFTLTKENVAKTYYFDPKIRVDPNS
jgi:hypothetical protein